jgi:hypothetical protein
MSNSRRRRLWICAALLTCFVTAGSSFAGPYEVQFHSGVVVPPAGQFEFPTTPASAGSVHVLVQLNDYLHRGTREALASAGLTLLSYLPDRAYVAAIEPKANATVLAALGVRSITPMRAEYKIHPRCLEKSFGAWSEFTLGRRIFAVDIMPDVTLNQAEAALKQIGCEIGYRFNVAHSILVALDLDKVVEIASLDAVLFVNEETPPMGPMNNIVRTRLHVNEVQAAPYNLNGDSVTVMVYDGMMVDSTHPDLIGRVHWIENGPVTVSGIGHATHVAGTLGGTGVNSTGQIYKGMAPAVEIISGQYNGPTSGPIFYDAPADFVPDLSLARRTFSIEASTSSIGINIEANGYPCAWFGDYELCARALDSLALNTEGAPLLLFFAAGNDRNGATCHQGYSSMSVPATAKNVITVGATNATDALASFSCAGPTDDGRMKPEICGDGVGVTSTVPGGGYATWDGTSMATPGVAGVGALILQQWHRLYPGAPDPLPETIKAIMINSTTPVGTAGPKYLSGFGIANALNAVQNVIAGGVLESALDVDEEYTRTFTVASGLSALDVSLAWSDVPAVGNVIPTLVNDLDIWLEDPSGAVKLPWRLRPTSPSVPATLGRDSINNCERVHVATPAAGTWTLHVAGTVNSGASQTFGVSANVGLVADWATIAGQVKSAGVGIPAVVTVVGQSRDVYTDSSGNYLVLLPANGTYNVRAVAFGYVPADSSVTITTGTSTKDITLAVAPSINVSGVVQNQYGAPFVGAVVQFSFPRASLPPETTDANGAYAINLPGGNSYAASADFLGIAHEGATVAVPLAGEVTQNFTINDPRYAPAGPDSNGYYAFESTDPGLSATYDWFEISPTLGGSGTAIQGASGNDWVVSVTLPFTMRFYGQNQTQLQVGADGWIRVGAPQAADTVYRNTQIPNTRTPNGMVCLFWDDLYPYDPAHPGDISYYYDEPNGRFIVEYNHVAHFNPRTNQVTAQLVIYTQAERPTRTGDNEFQLQYQTVDYYDGNPTSDADATVGIENYTGTDGIQIVFDGTYDTHCFPLGPEYAIRFTTGMLSRVEGQITMHPTPSNWSVVNVGLGSRSTHPDATGHYALDSVTTGAYTVVVQSPGYEIGSSAIMVTAADTLTRDFELFRLDPARNLVGVYDTTQARIRLNWDWPLSHAGLASGRPGGNHLDTFHGFKVMLAGVGRVASVSDTFYTFTVPSTGEYDFWIASLYDSGTADTSNHYRVSVSEGVGTVAGTIPTRYFLSQNYPNPFNPTTQIEYGLPKSSRITLDVFDILGRTVATLYDGPQDAGIHRVTFGAEGLGSGVYFFRLRSSDYVSVKKMLLMR